MGVETVDSLKNLQNRSKLKKYINYPEKKVTGGLLDGVKSSQNEVFEFTSINSKSIFVVKNLVRFHRGQIIKGRLS